MKHRRASCLVVIGLAVTAAYGCGRPGEPSAAAGPGAAVRSAVAGFYQPPSPLPDSRPGTLIRSAPFGAPAGYRAWRILYHSRDERGRDRAVSGFVVIGSGAAPRGGRPVVGASNSVSGVAAQCALSHANGAPAALVRAAKLFAAGAAYVFTDDPGIGTSGPHPYLVGAATGHAILDAARAAAQVPEVHAGHDVVLQGDTLGGQAALYAAAQAHRYAPELHLLGVAVGTPVVDVAGLLAHVVADTPFGVEFLMEMMAGFDGTGGLDPTSILTGSGRADLALLDRDCFDDFSQAVLGQAVGDAFRTDPLHTPPWPAAFATADPPTSGLTVPVLVTQAVHDNSGGNDVLYPIDLTTRYVDGLCQHGATVAYRMYPKLPHDGPDGATAADPDIVAWVLARFAGQAAPSTCG